MKRDKKWLIGRAAVVLAWLMGVLPGSASAMHIAEGYLPAGWAVFWSAVCLPFLAVGFQSIKKKVEAVPQTKILLAMCGAFAFVLSALKLPSITGSTSHPTGVGLGAVLFGPTAMSVLGLMVLLFQALLLAHGGLTTLGANTFSMAIAGPLAAWSVYQLLRRVHAPTAVAVFAAAALGDLLTYVITALQLGIVNGGIGRFLMVFAVTQIPIAIAEGLLTVVVFRVWSANQDGAWDSLPMPQRKGARIGK